MSKSLVVLFKSLGDVAMTTPIVKALKEKDPTGTIDFITTPPARHILEGNPNINKIIIMDNYTDANFYCIENNYDEIHRLGMANWLETNWHHLPEHQNQHMISWYAKRAGIENLIDKNIYVYLSAEDIDAVNDYWEDLDQSKKYIAIHTTSGVHGSVGSIESKDWPINRFSALAHRLYDEGYSLIQIGAFNDKKIKGVIDFTGKFSFKQNAEVIKRCVGYVGVDSGPAYLLNYSATPGILIMGATQHVSGQPSVGPFGTNIHYIHAPKPQNQNCTPVPCFVNCQIPSMGKGCITNISVDDVLNKLKEVLPN